MHLTRLLAELVGDRIFHDPPADVRNKALCCLLDAVICALAGNNGIGSIGATSLATRIFAGGVSPVWFSDYRLTPIGAAFANSASVCALDFDDGHRKARGHPGAAVIPTVLAVAADNEVDPNDIVAAIVAGYEIAIRIAAAQNTQTIKSRQSGLWAGYGAVASAGSLYQIRPDHLAHAMAISGVWAPNQTANGSSGYSKLTGNHAKEGIPWSVATGLTALGLAQTGYTGPEDILDHASYFDVARITNGLGQDWEIRATYFKPYSCCRYIHPAIDATLDLMQNEGLQPDAIQSIEVHTFQWATRLQNKITPRNLVEAQYSLPFCLALAVRRGASALAPIEQRVLDDWQLHSLARSVKLVVDDHIDQRFPAETLARIILTTSSGEFSSAITTPLGDSGRPMLWHELHEKFFQAASGKLTPARQEAFSRAIRQLECGNPLPLLQAISMRI